MPMSQYDSVTQKALQRLSENLEGMPRNMRQFSSVFRELYSDQAVGGQSEAAVKFRKIRDDTRKDAMVYLQRILPATTNFIRSVKEYFETYEALSYEEWCEMLPDILEETRTHKDLAQEVLGMHQDIMVPLKTRQDRARVVMTEFVNLQSVYHSSEGSRQGNTALAIASEKQLEINKNAARTVAETLIPALARFIDGLQNVAGFFQVVEKELKSFKDKSKEEMSERKQSHYNVIRNSVREIKSLCVSFYAVLPDVRTDFEALPSEDTDQNYVDKWLEKKLADIKSQPTLALLGTPSVIKEKKVPSNKRPEITPEDEPHVPKSKYKLAPSSKNRTPLTPVGDPVLTTKNKPPVLPKNNRPASTPIIDPVPTQRYKEATTIITRPASMPFDFSALPTGTASTPINESELTKNYIHAPTSNDRLASTPVDIRVPTSEDKQAKSPKIKRGTKSADDQTTLIGINKRATSNENLIERKQQGCRWRCIIM